MSHHSVRRRIASLAGLALPTVALLAPAGTGEAAYNVGVKSLSVTPYADVCHADQALPCTPHAGTGEANVLRVRQTIVDGYHRYTTLDGTSTLADHLWLGVEVDAECRRSHHIDALRFDADITNGDLDGGASETDADATGGPDAVAWPESVPVPEVKELSNLYVALNVPFDAAFDPANPLVGYFPSAEDITEAGEAEIERRMDEGMSAAEARAIPWELNTTVSVRAEVACRFNGLVPAVYEKRAVVAVPLRIDYLPVDVPAPLGEQPPVVDGLSEAARVVDAELAVVADPGDACTLHLSAAITTNGETAVDYRFLNPYGQPSNTYTVEVGPSHVAMVDHQVEVPYADTPDSDGDLAPTPGGGSIGGLTDAQRDRYTGTFELEILSPNPMTDADGFEVEYCTTGDPAIELPTGDVTAEPDPTHAPPTVAVLVTPTPPARAAGE